MSGKKVVQIIMLILSALLAAGRVIHDATEISEETDWRGFPARGALNFIVRR